MRSRRRETPFWDWSLAIYDRPGVKELLLTLQNKYALNVNAVLWAGWLGTNGWDIKEDQAEAILAKAIPMATHTVSLLREVRRFLKAPKPGFPEEILNAMRTDILTAELAGERAIQQFLAAETAKLAPPPSQSSGKAIADRVFSVCLTALEKPILIADDPQSQGARALFEQFWRDHLAEDAP